jgi:hypothetical protein
MTKHSENVQVQETFKFKRKRSSLRHSQNLTQESRSAFFYWTKEKDKVVDVSGC